MQLKEDNYIAIPAIARTQYDLKGNELLLYGLIHRFSQGDNSWCECTQQYMSDWIGCKDVKTVRNTLKKLIEVGAIEKDEYYVNNVKFCRYRIKNS